MSASAGTSVPSAVPVARTLSGTIFGGCLLDPDGVPVELHGPESADRGNGLCWIVAFDGIEHRTVECKGGKSTITCAYGDVKVKWAEAHGTDGKLTRFACVVVLMRRRLDWDVRFFRKEKGGDYVALYYTG